MTSWTQLVLVAVFLLASSIIYTHAIKCYFQRLKGNEEKDCEGSYCMNSTNTRMGTATWSCGSDMSVHSGCTKVGCGPNDDMSGEVCCCDTDLCNYDPPPPVTTPPPRICYNEQGKEQVCNQHGPVYFCWWEQHMKNNTGKALCGFGCTKVECKSLGFGDKEKQQFCCNVDLCNYNYTTAKRAIGQVKTACDLSKPGAGEAGKEDKPFKPGSGEAGKEDEPSKPGAGEAGKEDKPSKPGAGEAGKEDEPSKPGAGEATTKSGEKTASVGVGVTPGGKMKAVAVGIGAMMVASRLLF